MWVVGIATLVIVACGISLFIGWRPHEQARADIWDIAGTARTYTTIVGSLAGFSVTSSIFIANLSAARQSDAFESVMALFLIAFLIFISAAMQFGTTPNLAEHPSELYQTIQGYSYVLANASYYLGLALSWLGLPLLLNAIELDHLSEIFTWLVLFAILGGAMRLCGTALSNFVGFDLGVSLAVPPICFGLSCFYRLVLAARFEALLPAAEHDPTLFAVLCFVLAAVGFALQSAIVGSVRREAWAGVTARVGGRLLLAYMAGVVTVASLLWLSVAEAI